ncbi:MAG: hypothetical protein K0R43_665 [Pseudoduganella sp.]|jgi:zona occludens toxin|nr:hypothetical protein [Pseudoduganella sp.]
MPINVYTGLMRSGKSYEVVSEVIVPAIRAGRRVVTNVDGISQEKIHEYLRAKYPDDDHSKYGTVVHVTNAQVFLDEFFPYYDDAKDAHTDTVVQPGDLVAIDEAWRFWGDKMKIKKNHQSFFLEHGHFTHPETLVACDLVLMIQDMGTLNRFLKNVVAFSFRTHKKVALGMNNTYSLNMWEGNKMVKANQIGNWTRTYRKEIFPLYSSFKGGAQGVLVNADKRQNILTNKKLWGLLALLIVGGGVCFYNAWKFFHPAEAIRPGKGAAGAQAAQTKAGLGVPMSNQPRSIAPVFSDMWRVTGAYFAFGREWVVLTNAAGAVRLESPSNFSNAGLAQVGNVDGAKVTSWSGAAPKGMLAGGSSQPALVAHGFGPTVEEKK